jgi:DNA-binding transcriptional MerR regulator
VGEPARARNGWSIGEVLRRLRPEFPDVSISKIRFLEAEGLVTPQRSASGYRRFDESDLRRLHYVLAAQRDQYLPLRVIKEHLDAIDRGLQPPELAGPPRVPLATVAAGPTGADFESASQLRMSVAELSVATGLSAEAIAALVGYGLISPLPGTDHYDADALGVAEAVAGFGRFGLEPRHLKSFKSAADREIGMIEQVVTPMSRVRGPESAGRAVEAARELASLSVRLHTALVRAGLPASAR